MRITCFVLDPDAFVLYYSRTATNYLPALEAVLNLLSFDFNTLDHAELLNLREALKKDEKAIATLIERVAAKMDKPLQNLFYVYVDADNVKSSVGPYKKIWFEKDFVKGETNYGISTIDDIPSPWKNAYIESREVAR